jgi:geranylgeranyl pyrophosphate synthase
MLTEKFSAYSAMTDRKLGELLANDSFPPVLSESMAYSVFSGGKRLRPSLCMAACEYCGGAAEDALLAACAVELIHTYSLIHDDLPSMDNDDFRRGKPSNHKAFGEANAVLAGDGLQSLAFLALSDCMSRDAVGHIARGALEMIMGQSLDMSTCGGADQLTALQDYKTAALFRAAVGSGAACARSGGRQMEALLAFASAYGMLFQITDDILDFEGSAETLGKSVGKDAASGKTTFATVYGVEGAKTYAQNYARDAKKAIGSAGGDATLFMELIDYTLNRRA